MNADHARFASKRREHKRKTTGGAANDACEVVSLRFTQNDKKKFGETAELFFYNEIMKHITDVDQKDAEWDFEANGIPVEVKSAQLCIGRGRNGEKITENFRYNFSGFTLQNGQHETLLEHKGWYCFILMLREECIKATMLPANKIYNHFMYKLKPMTKTRVSFNVFFSKNAASIEEFAKSKGAVSD